MSRAVRESHDCDSAVRVRINVRFLAESLWSRPQARNLLYEFNKSFMS